MFQSVIRAARALLRVLFSCVASPPTFFVVLHVAIPLLSAFRCSQLRMHSCRSDAAVAPVGNIHLLGFRIDLELASEELVSLHVHNPLYSVFIVSHDCSLALFFAQFALVSKCYGNLT